MTTAQAYQIVLRDIVDKDCGLLVGRFDARHEKLNSFRMKNCAS